MREVYIPKNKIKCSICGVDLIRCRKETKASCFDCKVKRKKEQYLRRYNENKKK
jgi:hypothetical protein